MLANFYHDEITREEVKEFFLAELDKYALECVYQQEDTKGIAQAKEVIIRAFSELEAQFKKEKNLEIKNIAR